MAREQELENLGRLPGGGSIGTGFKRWLDTEADRREKKSISGKGNSINKGPEVGQVEEQTAASWDGRPERLVEPYSILLKAEAFVEAWGMVRAGHLSSLAVLEERSWEMPRSPLL